MQSTRDQKVVALRPLKKEPALDADLPRRLLRDGWWLVAPRPRPAKAVLTLVSGGRSPRT